jgi:DNA-binding MarR family transcriptional regulator
MSRRTPTGQRLTELILETFRLNGALLSRGDRLVADIGLTSARWQVLGAVALAGRPLSVAQIARRMGLSRQAVQRIANDLQAAGLTAYRVNPDHKRAKLVTLSKQGELAYARADARQAAWVNAIGKGLDPTIIVDALRLLRLVHDCCREGGDAGPQTPQTSKTHKPSKRDRRRVRLAKEGTDR